MADRTIVSPARPYRPLSEDAYDALRDAVLKGRLAPGERIVEAEVARQMAISRGPVREAIRKLERDGLVRYLPRRGTILVTLSSDEVRDTYYLRAHLEAYAARRVAGRATDEDLVGLERLIDRMHECAARNDLEGLIIADVEFHGRICQASGSKRLYQLWDSLNPHCWTLFSSLKVARYTLSQIAERHRPVLAALQSPDADRAEAAIRDHITELADAVLAHLAAADTPDRSPMASSPPQEWPPAQTEVISS